MRVFGALLILAAFVGAGAVYMLSKKRRIEALRDMSAALERMQGELSARGAPLPELCRLLAERGQGAAGAFFKALSGSLERLGEADFTALWREAAEKSLGALNTAERDEISMLGDLVGRCALEEQLSALRLCCAQLRTGLEAARRDYPGERRLGLGLGVSAGLLLIIVLF